MSSAISILDDLAEGRFARFSLIAWWDQARLAKARVLVVGAGALGNEIIKNLALLGVGNLFIADRDRVEASNLSRSVLFRQSDIGRPKAVVAAEMARQIYPQMKVWPWCGDVVSQLGSGVVRWADVVLGALDNREARLWINRTCWRLGRPWVDGAIEQIQGLARVFVPDAQQQRPCYECTMTARDWELISQRRACNMLTRSPPATGRTATTPTISSIIAGVQTQQAVKLLHGLDTRPGVGWTYVGLTGEAFDVHYQRRADCLSHETLAQVIEVRTPADQLTLARLLDHARRHLGAEPTIDLHRDIVEGLDCPTCGRREEVMSPLTGLREGQAVCECPAATRRAPRLLAALDATSPHAGRSLASLGVPPFDVLTARSGLHGIGLELSADGTDVLGPLDSGALQWL